jgi:cytidylate kinase
LQRLFLDDEDVSDAIRSAEVTANVSLVSSHPAVRTAMVRTQRSLADTGGVVLEGRDIGSVVLPSADVKIYLDASIDVRAQRRCKELNERGVAAELEAVRASIKKRDELDSTRELSPLTVPIGACVVDTSELSIEEQVDEVRRIAERTAERIAGLVTQKGRRYPYRRRRPFWMVGYILVSILARILGGLRVFKKDRTEYAETYIYASNHRSNLDPPLVGASVNREIHFVAKRSLFKSWWFGRLIANWNAIPIRRGMFDRGAVDRLLEVLSEEKSVLIFPEGSRMSGDQLGESRPGVGYLALKSGKPVVPVYIEGSNRLRSAIARKPRITVIHGKPMRLTDPDLTRYQDADHFRDFGRMVMTAIAALKDEHERRRRQTPPTERI